MLNSSLIPAGERAAEHIIHLCHPALRPFFSTCIICTASWDQSCCIPSLSRHKGWTREGWREACPTIGCPWTTLLIRVLGAPYHCSSILPASRREGNPSPARSAEGDLPTTLASPKAAAPRSDFGAPWQNRNCKLQLVGLQWSLCSPKHLRLVSFTLCAWAPSSPGKSRWESSPVPAGMDQVRPFIPLLVGGSLALVCGALGVILHHR